MRVFMMLGLFSIAVVGLSLSDPLDSRAATEAPTMAPGGGQTPPTGGRTEEQTPQLGSGNRGTGQRGTQGGGSIDPGKVRSAPTGPGLIVGQVLSIQGDTYILRQPDGHEVILNSTPKTDVPSVISMGQTVEAQVDNTGAVTQIKPARR
jgi:hypothetical protein